MQNDYIYFLLVLCLYLTVKITWWLCCLSVLTHPVVFTYIWRCRRQRWCCVGDNVIIMLMTINWWRVNHPKTTALIDAFCFFGAKKDGQIALPDWCLRPTFWGGAGVLGSGFQSGGAMLLVHVQYSSRHTGMLKFCNNSFFYTFKNKTRLQFKLISNAT